jgi:hypothetical protein
MTQLAEWRRLLDLRGALAVPADRAAGGEAEFRRGAPLSAAVTSGHQPVVRIMITDAGRQGPEK